MMAATVEHSGAQRTAAGEPDACGRLRGSGKEDETGSVCGTMRMELTSGQRCYILFRSAAERIVAAVLMILLSPLFVVIASVIRCTMGFPVFYNRARIGRGGRRFAVLKFRSMVNDPSPGGGDGSIDSERITAFGAFLRRTSLDELPQLLNVLRGDMSFIGPRPMVPDLFVRCTAQQKCRVLVPQGVTGLAQVLFRNNATWSARIVADLDYINRIGFGIDLKIVVLTVAKVLRSEDIRMDQSTDEVDDLGTATIE